MREKSVCVLSECVCMWVRGRESGERCMEARVREDSYITASAHVPLIEVH